MDSPINAPSLDSPEHSSQSPVTDPSGRYVKLKNELLGRGSFKEVYKAYDRQLGIEVAWNQIQLFRLSEKERKQLQSEVDMLKSIHHRHIIRFYDSWVSPETHQIIFISELMSSGTLKAYITKFGPPLPTVLKTWCRQILEGLDYLHSRLPKIIHRDLKCDNIFINGNNGEVKIGDLGLSTQLRESRSKSVIGTPEFMAPELYEESYNEKVDIYAFGMCVLEMVTQEYPYSECTSAAQIYRKVSQNIFPQSLQKVTDPALRRFIESCLQHDPAMRPSASELRSSPYLNDPEAEHAPVSGTDMQPPSVRLHHTQTPAEAHAAASPRAGDTAAPGGAEPSTLTMAMAKASTAGTPTPEASTPSILSVTPMMSPGRCGAVAGPGPPPPPIEDETTEDAPLKPRGSSASHLSPGTSHTVSASSGAVRAGGGIFVSVDETSGRHGSPIPAGDALAELSPGSPLGEPRNPSWPGAPAAGLQPRHHHHHHHHHHATLPAAAPGELSVSPSPEEPVAVRAVHPASPPQDMEPSPVSQPVPLRAGGVLSRMVASGEPLSAVRPHHEGHHARHGLGPAPLGRVPPPIPTKKAQPFATPSPLPASPVCHRPATDAALGATSTPHLPVVSAARVPSAVSLPPRTSSPPLSAVVVLPVASPSTEPMPIPPSSDTPPSAPSPRLSVVTVATVVAPLVDGTSPTEEPVPRSSLAVAHTTEPPPRTMSPYTRQSLPLPPPSPTPPLPPLSPALPPPALPPATVSPTHPSQQSSHSSTVSPQQTPPLAALATPALPTFPLAMVGSVAAAASQPLADVPPAAPTASVPITELTLPAAATPLASPENYTYLAELTRTVGASPDAPSAADAVVSPLVVDSAIDRPLTSNALPPPPPPSPASGSAPVAVPVTSPAAQLSGGPGGQLAGSAPDRRCHTQQMVQLKLTLRLHTGLQEVKFPFKIGSDTPQQVAQELVAEFGLHSTITGQIAASIEHLRLLRGRVRSPNTTFSGQTPPPIAAFNSPAPDALLPEGASALSPGDTTPPVPTVPVASLPRAFLAPPTPLSSGTTPVSEPPALVARASTDSIIALETVVFKRRPGILVNASPDADSDNEDLASNAGADTTGPPKEIVPSTTTNPPSIEPAGARSGRSQGAMDFLTDQDHDDMATPGPPARVAQPVTAETVTSGCARALATEKQHLPDVPDATGTPMATLGASVLLASAPQNPPLQAAPALPSPATGTSTDKTVTPPAAAASVPTSAALVPHVSEAPAPASCAAPDESSALPHPSPALSLQSSFENKSESAPLPKQFHAERMPVISVSMGALASAAATAALATTTTGASAPALASVSDGSSPASATATVTPGPNPESGTSGGPSQSPKVTSQSPPPPSSPPPPPAEPGPSATFSPQSGLVFSAGVEAVPFPEPLPRPPAPPCPGVPVSPTPASPASPVGELVAVALPPLHPPARRHTSMSMRTPPHAPAPATHVYPLDGLPKVHSMDSVVSASSSASASSSSTSSASFPAAPAGMPVALCDHSTETPAAATANMGADGAASTHHISLLTLSPTVHPPRLAPTQGAHAAALVSGAADTAAAPTGPAANSPHSAASKSDFADTTHERASSMERLFSAFALLYECAMRQALFGEVLPAPVASVLEQVAHLGEGEGGVGLARLKAAPSHQLPARHAAEQRIEELTCQLRELLSSHAAALVALSNELGGSPCHARGAASSPSLPPRPPLLRSASPTHRAAAPAAPAAPLHQTSAPAAASDVPQAANAPAASPSTVSSPPPPSGIVVPSIMSPAFSAILLNEIDRFVPRDAATAAITTSTASTGASVPNVTSAAVTDDVLPALGTPCPAPSACSVLHAHVPALPHGAPSSASVSGASPDSASLGSSGRRRASSLSQGPPASNHSSGAIASAPTPVPAPAPAPAPMHAPVPVHVPAALTIAQHALGAPPAHMHAHSAVAPTATAQLHVSAPSTALFPSATEVTSPSSEPSRVIGNVSAPSLPMLLGAGPLPALACPAAGLFGTDSVAAAVLGSAPIPATVPVPTIGSLVSAPTPATAPAATTASTPTPTPASTAMPTIARPTLALQSSPVSARASVCSGARKLPSPPRSAMPASSSSGSGNSGSGGSRRGAPPSPPETPGADFREFEARLLSGFEADLHHTSTSAAFSVGLGGPPPSGSSAKAAVPVPHGTIAPVPVASPALSACSVSSALSAGAAHRAPPAVPPTAAPAPDLTSWLFGELASPATPVVPAVGGPTSPPPVLTRLFGGPASASTAPPSSAATTTH